MNTKVQKFDTGKWVVSGNSVQATVILQEGRLLWHMDGTAPGMDVENGDLGSITVSGEELRWDKLIEARQDIDPKGSCNFEITVEDSARRLRMTRFITAFQDRPFVRTWGLVVNAGSEAVQIDGCAIFSMTLGSQLPLSLFHVEQLSAAYRRDFFRPNELRLIAGRAAHEIRMGSFPSQHWQPTSCAFFALLSDRTGFYSDKAPVSHQHGLVCGLEFNGKSRVRAWADPQCAQLVSSIDDLAHRLLPGEEFEIPAFFAGRFEGDWDEAGYVIQRFAEQYVHPPMPDDCYPWAQYNSWAYDQNINEQQQLAAIDRCAELGLELAVLDLGWAKQIGDWQPDPVKFPRGLRPLVERAKSYGMRFGVHIALAQCNVEAPIAKEHPEWLIHTGTDYFGAAALCLGHEPCRSWLIEQLSRLITEHGIDYVIQDGEDMVKCCSRTDHTHSPGNSNYANSQYGLDIVIGALRNRHPALVIENCEDGGCMMTYKMGRLYHTSITVDNIDTYSTRQGIFGASYPFSPRYSVRYMQDAPTMYTLYSSIFGGPIIFMHRITEWSPREVEETRMAVKKYKELRSLIRDAKIIHLKMPQYNNEDGGWGWDAIQAVSQDKSESVVMVYRAKGDEGVKIFKPRGLEPEAMYELRFDRQGNKLVCTGLELQEKGVSVQLEELGAEILYIRRTEA